jgi:hypothetical protein
MRQFLHTVVGVVFWAMLAAAWVLLWVDGKATGTAFRDTLVELAVLIGVVLAVTTWWIRHNVGIYRRKGPRRGRPETPVPTDEDRLGRRVRWAMPGGVRTARAEQHLVIDVEGDVKLYRREC